MRRLWVSSICLLLASLATPWVAQAEVSIPLSNDGLPASDLIDGDSSSHRILNPQEAWALKKRSRVDLSMLEPDATSDIWGGVSTEQDDALDDTLPIQNGDTVTFLGFISSSPGRFRFNVQVQSGNEPPRTLTLMLSKELHTTLLRKGLLRRLGYKIPPMKHLGKINVILPDTETHDKTFPAALVDGTLGAANRWQIAPPAGASHLTITLQDVVAMEATPLYYNVAMGPPIERIGNSNQLRPSGPRIIRALGPIYGLANIPENIHQSSWYVGRVEDGQIVMDITDRANFACTLDDARWISRRIQTLSRQDFEAIVAQAHYPDFVAKLVVENLIARRNSLMGMVGVQSQDLSFDPNVSYGSQLANGKLVNQDWQALGYASNFAGSEPQSPLKDIWWYVVSQLQSNFTANLLQKINNKLPQLSAGDAINQHNEKLYNDALEQYLKDGSAQTVHFGAWTAPVASGGVDISRDIVIGSYMGTTGENGSSNIVQLADNFGFHASAGLYIGFDGMPVTPYPTYMQGQVMGSASIAVTHLKPITSLKAAVKEPLKNEFVPWIFGQASHVLNDIVDIQNGAAQESPNVAKEKLANKLEELKNFIGKGESLIITESLGLNESLQIGIQGPVPFSPGVGVQPAANQVLLWRLHIYRPENNPNMLMVFKDNGALKGVQVSLNLNVGSTATLPVVQLTAKGVSGTADTEYFRVNVNPDPQANPQIYANAAALSTALRGRSLEALREVQKPTLISTRFHDTSKSFQFLYYVNRSLKTNGLVTVSLPNGVTDSFISLSDGNQKGGNYQSLGTQIANTIIQKLSNSPDVNIDTKASQNPGQTYKGYSSTRNATLQARAADQISELFGKVQYRWEGWDIASPDVQNLVESLSRKYGFVLYPDHFMHDTREVQLYSITLSINLYESALKSILSITPSAEKALVKRYTDFHHCYAQRNDDDPAAPTANIDECWAIRHFESGYAIYHPETRGWLDSLLGMLSGSNDSNQMSEFFRSYWQGAAASVAQAEAALQIFSSLEQFVSFQDLVALTGGVDSSGQPRNMYVQSTVSGFRVGSENISEPIQSNTYGHVNPDQSGGPLDSAQQILGVDDGEFEAQWLRDHL